MPRQHRIDRAAVSAVVLAAVIGAAGTTGLSTVLGADPPAALTITGSVVDEHGTSLGGVALVVAEERSGDGGLYGDRVTTSADGSFTARLQPWGTPDAPATLTIRTAPDTTIEILGTSCTRTLGVAVSDIRTLAAEGLIEAPPPIDLVASTTVLGEVCGTTATATATPPPGAGSESGHGRDVTPPPTDAVPAWSGRPEERLAPALVVGFVVGLLAAALLLVRRPGARRRD